MPAPAPRCVLDRSRPCNSCVADSPRECPYPYLLADEPRPVTTGAAADAEPSRSTYSHT